MSDKLYKLALLVIFVLAVIQVVNIYTSYEHLNPALLTHQDEDWQKDINGEHKVTYYKRGDRYNKENKFNPTLEDPLHVDPGLSCGPKMDWDVDATPGANNVYGDLIWHKAHPKMVLQDNCLSCKHHKNVSYNEPSGVASSLTSQLDEI